MYSILHRIGSIMFFSLHFSPSIANPNENISFPFMCRLVFVEVHFKSPRNCVPTWNRCHRYRSIWYGIQIHRKTRWKTIMNIKVLNLSTAKLITNSTYICLLCVNASLSMAEIPPTIYHHSLIWYDCRCCLLLVLLLLLLMVVVMMLLTRCTFHSFLIFAFTDFSHSLVRWIDAINSNNITL